MSSMYIFDRVTAKVVETKTSLQPFRLEFDFYQGTQKLPFSEAKKVADPVFLENRVAEVKEAYAQQNVGKEIELTSDTSKIRGYQGGLCHIAMINAKPYLVLLRRGADAPTSPLMLDIAAGRMDDSDETWEETMLREGTTEIGYYGREGRVLPTFDRREFSPQIIASLTGKVMSAYEQVGIDRERSKEKMYESNSVSRLFDRNDTYAHIRVHDRHVFVSDTVSAGWTALPHLSSIELFQHMVLQLSGDIQFSDLEYDEKRRKPVHRDVYVIEMATGNTHVWNAGQKVRVENIGILLAENKTVLGKLADKGEMRRNAIHPVSPKVLAAIEQLPTRFKTHHDCSGLDIMSVINTL